MAVRTAMNANQQRSTAAPRSASHGRRVTARRPAPCAAASSLGVETEKVAGTCRTCVRVTVPAGDMDASWDNVMKEIAENVRVEGFKPGEAPRKLVMEAVNEQGRAALRGAVLEDALSTAMPRALESAGLLADTINDSERIETPAAELVAQLGDGSDSQDLTFAISIETVPEVTFTGSYKGLEVVVPSSPSDADFDALVERGVRVARQELGSMTVAAGRGFATGDVGIVNMSATLSDGGVGDGEEIESARAEGFRVDSCDEAWFPALRDAMLGMNAGEEKSITATFPSTWQPPELRGRSASFDVKLREVFSCDLADEGAEVAEQVAPGCGGDMAAARAALMESSRDQAREEDEAAIDSAVAKAIVKVCDAPVPETLVFETGMQLFSASMLKLQEKGLISYERAQELATNESVAEYCEANRAEVEANVRAELALSAVCAAEGLAASDEEVQALANEMMTEMREGGSNEEEINDEALTSSAREELNARNAYKFLRENASITRK